MPRPKALSGEEVIGVFLGFGFEVASQRGSHIKLRRVMADGIRQTLTIPNHSELDKGTVHAIFRQALRYISEEDLRPRFYTERCKAIEPIPRTIDKHSDICYHLSVLSKYYLFLRLSI